MTGARRDGWRSTDPATTGCPKAAGGCRRPELREIRGEWRGRSSGRRVVAASVLASAALASAVRVEEYQPGYDGLARTFARPAIASRVMASAIFVAIAPSSSIGTPA